MRREDVDFKLPEPWIRWQEKMNRLQDERRPALLLATAVFLAVVAAAAWRLEIHEAAVLGMAVAFAAVVLTCYYWVMLLLVPLGRGRWGPTAAWLGLNTGIYALHLSNHRGLSFEMLYGSDLVGARDLPPRLDGAGCVEDLPGRVEPDPGPRGEGHRVDRGRGPTAAAGAVRIRGSDQRQQSASADSGRGSNNKQGQQSAAATSISERNRDHPGSEGKGRSSGCGV